MRLTVKGHASSFPCSLVVLLLFCLLASLKYWSGLEVPSILNAVKSVVRKEEEAKQVNVRSHAHHLCDIHELVHGTWRRGVEKDHPPYIPMRGEAQQNTCPGFDPNAKWQDYDWVPSSGCQFNGSDFDQSLYCSLVQGKLIAIIGDSVSFDHFLSLSHLMGKPQALPRAMKKTALLTSELCNQTSTLLGKRDFHLQEVNRILTDYNPDIVFLNRGAHVVEDDQLMSDMNHTLLPWIADWQTNCTKHGRECHFVWRTSIPGHPNCENYTAPSDSVEEMEQTIESDSKYNWQRFQQQNKLIRNWLEEQTLICFDILDAYYSHILRPDWHPSGSDCLHTCLPKDNLLSFFTLHLLRLWNETKTNISQQ